MQDGEMWQRFTNPATRVIHFAQEEAKRLGVNVVGTEHILLGLLREGKGVAARVLERLGISLGRVRSELAHQVGTPEGHSVGSTRLTLSPKAKKALEYSLQEARDLNPKLGLLDFVDTEHLLLSLIHEESYSGSKAARLLKGLDVSPDNIRQAVMQYLSENPKSPTLNNMGEEQIMDIAQSNTTETQEISKQETTYEDLEVYKRAFSTALRIFEVSKKFPQDEPSTLAIDMDSTSRLICAIIADAWLVRHDKPQHLKKYADAKRKAVEMQVWFDFAVGYRFMSEDSAKDFKWEYSQIINTLNDNGSE